MTTGPWESFAPSTSEDGPWTGFSKEDGKLPPETKAQPETKAGSMWSSKAGRFAQGMAEPLVGLGQLAAHVTGYGTETMDSAAQRLADLYAASRKEAGIGKEDWDYFAGAGNLASPINFVPGAAIGRVAGPAKTMLGMAGRGAAAGASYGATQPVTDLGKDQTYAGEKTGQILTGGATGGVFGPAAGMVAGAVKPKITEAAQKLLNEGVELTPGQMLGGNYKRVEDIAAKTPIVGSWIREAQNRSLESFNKAAGNRALAPIGESLPEGMKMGHDAMQHIEGKLGAAYEELHPKLKAQFDPDFHADIAAIDKASRQAGESLPAAQRKQLEDMINGVIDRAGPNGTDVLTGETVHGVASSLGREAAGYASDPNFDNRKLGAALGSVKDAFDAMLERQNPEYAEELRRINKGYANYVRLRKAASSTASGAREGVFTPTQLNVASAAMDKTAGRGASAKGQALLQDLAESGRQTLPAALADSGTAERMLTHGLMAGHIAMSPQTAVLSALIPGLYSKVGLDFARKALTARPGGAQAISDVLRKYAPVQGTQSALSLTGQEKT